MEELIDDEKFNWIYWTLNDIDTWLTDVYCTVCSVGLTREPSQPAYVDFDQTYVKHGSQKNISHVFFLSADIVFEGVKTSHKVEGWKCIVYNIFEIRDAENKSTFFILRRTI